MNTPKTLLAVAVAACGLVWAGGTAQAQTPSKATQNRVKRLVEDGKALKAKGEYEDALEKFDKAAELDPKNVTGVIPDALAESAWIHNENKDYDDAKQAATDALNLDLMSAAAWRELGYARWKQGDVATAKTDFYYAIQYDPGLMNSYEYLIQVIEEEVAVGGGAAAKRELRKVKKMKEEAEKANANPFNPSGKTTRRED